LLKHERATGHGGVDDVPLGFPSKVFGAPITPTRELGRFGAQPGTYHAEPDSLAAVPSSPFSISTVSAPSFSSYNQSSVATTSLAGRSGLSPMSKCLVLVAVMFRKNKINQEQKGILKDLILQENRIVYAAMEAFEITQDLEDLVDTCQHILSF